MLTDIYDNKLKRQPFALRLKEVPCERRYAFTVSKKRLSNGDIQHESNLETHFPFSLGDEEPAVRVFVVVIL